MQNKCPYQSAEMEAALKIAQVMQREYGLSPAGTSADLHGDILTVKLKNAVSSMGQIVAHEEGGREILQSTYAIFDDINRRQVDALVSGIVGRSVHHSAIEPDLTTGDIFITFHLGIR